MKTNLDRFYKTDPHFEKSGIWINIGDETGPGFLIKPFKQSNPNVKAAMAKFYMPYAAQIEKRALPDEKVLAINIQLFLEASLVDWRNVEIDAAVVPYDKVLALKFFEALPDLFNELWARATDYKNFLAEVGNSSPAD